MFTRQIKTQIGMSTLIILPKKGKMPTLAGIKHPSVHSFPHRPRLIHLPTEEVRVESVRNGYQSGYSLADTNYNIKKIKEVFHKRKLIKCIRKII